MIDPVDPKAESNGRAAPAGIRPGMQAKGASDGFALVAVIAVTALLSTLLVAMSLWARNAAESTAVAVAEVATDALIQSGVNVAGYELFVQKLPRSRVDGQTVVLDAGTLSISVGDDVGKVDLNAADATLLATAYRAAGLSRIPAETFAARIADWRDGDNEAVKNGAEADAYRKARLPAPRNGPFQAVGELGWVLGVTQADASALQPFTTVFNPGGKLDPFATPRRLLELLPGVSSAKIGQVLAIRGGGRNGESIARLKALLAEQSGLLDFGPPLAFRVVVRAQSKLTGRRMQAEAVLIKSAEKSRPFQIVDWRE